MNYGLPYHLLEIDEVEVQTEGKVIKDWCHVLVNGTGFLNNWKCKVPKSLGGHFRLLTFGSQGQKFPGFIALAAN
jgi:hypothetical protein